MYVSARTTCVRRSLIPNVETLEFGEIPVLLKQTQEILIKNIGNVEQTLKMETMTPYGGFSVINALRTVKPGETKSIIVQFEPFSQQIYEEDLKIFTAQTMVSIKLKGIGVRPEVGISIPDGLLSFGNIIANEQQVKTFNVRNVSGFPVKFELNSKISGVENHSLLTPFTLIPAHGQIEAMKEYEVKIIFQPDHESDHFFNILLVDVPNQKEEKEIFMRGWCYSRQVFVREFEPFEWKPISALRQKFEEPLEQIAIQTAKRKALDAAGAQAADTGKGGKAASVQIDPNSIPRKRIVLTYKRDEEVEEISDNEQFLKEQNRVRKILIGNCKMMDTKMEKNGAYELTAGVSFINSRKTTSSSSATSQRETSTVARKSS